MSQASRTPRPMSSLTDQPAPDPAVAARVEELYASHAALVRSVCRALLRNRVEEEDAFQQTFLSAQRALLNGSSPREPAAWLATIARHECFARIQARMREPLPVESEEQAAGADTHAAAVHRHEAAELRDALAELPAQQRDAILLREMRGLSYQEVAATLSVTNAAVESLLFRARRTLQMRLREALAAFAPAEWAQPLRELLARVAGPGLAPPAAAKLAAVGVGTAVVAGGAISGPTVLGLGHAPTPAAKPAQRVRHRPSSPASPHVFVLPRAASPAPPVREVVDRRPQRPARVVEDRSREAKSSEAPEVAGATARESSDGAGTTSGKDGGSPSGSPSAAGDDGTTQPSSSGSTADSATNVSDDPSADQGGSSSGTTTTTTTDATVSGD